MHPPRLLIYPLYLDSEVSGPRQPGPGLHILVVIFSVQGPAHSGDEQYGGGCSDHARDQIAGTRALTLDVHFTGTATRNHWSRSGRPPRTQGHNP